MKNLEKVLFWSLAVQIVMYIIGLSIGYNATHDGSSDFSGLGALIPFGIFGFLCVVNLILFLLYLMYMRKVRKQVNIWLVSLFAVNLILALGFNYAFHIINRLPGSDLPGY